MCKCAARLARLSKTKGGSSAACLLSLALIQGQGLGFMVSVYLQLLSSEALSW